MTSNRLLGLFVVLAAYGAGASTSFDCPIFQFKGESFATLVFEDFTAPSSNIDGRLAVGRNLDVSAYSIGSDKYLAVDTVVVGHDAKWETGNLKGNIVYGHKENIGSSLKYGMTGDIIKNAGRYNFAEAANYYQELSDFLVVDGNEVHIDSSKAGHAKGNGDSPSVFKLTCEQLLSLSSLEITSPNPDVMIVMNVYGDDCEVSFFTMSVDQSLNASQILWNFSSAKTLKLEGVSLTGSVLAPYADVKGVSGIINGQMVAKSFNGQIEMNDVALQTCFDGDELSPSPSVSASYGSVPSVSRVASVTAAPSGTPSNTALPSASASVVVIEEVVIKPDYGMDETLVDFVNLPGTALMCCGPDEDSIFEDVEVSECAELCIARSTWCKSFDYMNRNCYLKNRLASDLKFSHDGRCTSVQIPECANSDHYDLQPTTVDLVANYQAVEEHSLMCCAPEEDAEFFASVAECGQACLDRQWCKSFDYGEGKCYLKNKNSYDVTRGPEGFCGGDDHEGCTMFTHFDLLASTRLF